LSTSVNVAEKEITVTSDQGYDPREFRAQMEQLDDEQITAVLHSLHRTVGVIDSMGKIILKVMIEREALRTMKTKGVQ